MGEFPSSQFDNSILESIQSCTHTRTKRSGTRGFLDCQLMFPSSVTIAGLRFVLRSRRDPTLLQPILRFLFGEPCNAQGVKGHPCPQSNTGSDNEEAAT